MMANTQQPGATEAQDKSESVEIARSSKFTAEAMVNALSELSQGMFVDVSPKDQKGDLIERDVLDFLATIGEIGLESFTAEAPGWGYAETEMVTFRHKDPRGAEYEIQSYCPKYGDLRNAGDSVLRDVHVFYRPKPGIAPTKSLTISNSETSGRDLRTLSVIRYSSNLYRETADARPPVNWEGFLPREITLVNPHRALYNDDGIEYVN